MHSLLIAPASQGDRATPPERAVFDGAVADGRILQRMLNVVDYGMLLLAADGRVAFANTAARNDLDPTHPLALVDGQLQARHARDLVPLREALASAVHKGLQRLLTLRDDDGAMVGIAIVPIGEPGRPTGSGVMLMLGKRKACDELSAEAFVRQHKLTLAEARVLKQLSVGLRPAEIARHQGVALSTVRTQIGCMREKTGAPSISALVSELARLPPMPSLLRAAA